MAKVVVTVDTETKELSVTLNGTEIQDVDYVSVDRYRKDYPEMKMVSIHTTNSKEEGDLEVYTSTYTRAAVAKDVTKYLQEKGLI